MNTANVRLDRIVFVNNVTHIPHDRTFFVSHETLRYFYRDRSELNVPFLDLIHGRFVLMILFLLKKIFFCY